MPLPEVAHYKGLVTHSCWGSIDTSAFNNLAQIKTQGMCNPLTVTSVRFGEMSDLPQLNLTGHRLH